MYGFFCPSVYKPSFICRKSVIALCKSMEILKAVEATYHRHSLAVVSLTGHICQKLVSSLILTIGRAKVCTITYIDLSTY